MSRHTYRLEAGRCIMRDSKPFAVIHHARNVDNYEYVSPTEVDDFAHVCTAATDLLDACRRAAYVLKECGYCFPVTEECYDDVLAACIAAIEKAENPYG